MAHTQRYDPPLVDPQWVTLIATATMLGLVMAFSASYPKACAGGDTPDALSFFKPQLMYALIGIAAGWVISLMRPRFLRTAAVPALGVCFILMAIAIVQGMRGEETRGSSAWVEFGPVRFQPSEFAKLFYVVYLASLLSVGPLRGKYLRRIGQPLAICAGLFCMLLFGQHDLGMMILVVVITFAMAFLGGMEIKPLLLAMGGALFLALAYGLLDGGERGGRFAAFINPFVDHSRNGYHILTMLVAISRGGLFGAGLGDCPDKWGQMPEAHTDAIFCVMGGELGFIRLAAFLVLVGWIVVRALQIGRQSGDSFSHLMCTGIGAMIGLQALINMAVATRLMPVTGLTLPYISYGGSSLISCLMAAGAVLSVYRHQQPPQHQEAD